MGRWSRRVALAAMIGAGPVAVIPAPATAQATPSPAATPTAIEPQQLAPVVWGLTALLGPDDASFPIDAPERYTLQALPSGELRVQADCNRGFGRWREDGDGVRFTVAGVTRVACGEASGSEAFLAAIAATTAWRYEGADLVLAAGELPILRLTPQLVGVTWEWAGLAEGDGSATLPEGPERYTVEFLDGGVAEIRADCNSGRARYRVYGSQIELTDVAITRKGCESGSLDQEFLAGLTESTSFVFEAGRLYLALPVDAGIHTFVPRASDDAGDAPER